MPDALGSDGRSHRWVGAVCVAGIRIKITDLRIVPQRVERPLGSLVDFNGNTRSYQLGGGNFVTTLIGDAVLERELRESARVQRWISDDARGAGTRRHEEGLIAS